MRARLRARYQLNDKISLGAGIATGDPDNPNSTDVTVSDFADGLDVSLDQLYARFAAHDLVLDIGKFPQIFRRTDLVWDGDVNPQGVGVRYEHSLGAASSIDARALYFIVDEAAAGEGSSMIGGQVGLATALVDGWVLDAGVGYLDYHLSGISGGDLGDFRSNLLRPDGSYLSDFDLLELVGSIDNHSIDPPLPIEVRFDFVRNLGAATRADTGYLAELVLGTARRRGDFSFGYGYAVAETDAVFAAFSHDNIELATNYQLHSLAADYLPLENVILNLTYYRYRPFQREPDTLHGWRNRLRLNLMFEF